MIAIHSPPISDTPIQIRMYERKSRSIKLRQSVYFVGEENVTLKMEEYRLVSEMSEKNQNLEEKFLFYSALEEILKNLLIILTVFFLSPTKYSRFSYSTFHIFWTIINFFFKYKPVFLFRILRFFKILNSIIYHICLQINYFMHFSLTSLSRRT